MSGCLKRQLGRSILFRIFICLSFFISGLTINLVQLILFMTLGFFNIKLYRRLNYYLTYGIWSQVVALAQWWADTELTIYYADERSKRLMASNHMLSLMNHTFEVDWLVAWLTIDHYHQLGNAKSFAKKSLRWLPIMGWSWVFNEFAFLERNAEKDTRTIIDRLKRYLQFETPVPLLFFAEGTRFTKEKHEASIKFAQERGLPVLKHHLVPRTKGFLLSIDTFKQESPETLVAQMELRFPKDSPNKPSITTLLEAGKLNPHLYLKVFPVSEVPSGSEQETNNFIYGLYKEMDDLAEHFEQNGKFPGTAKKVKPRITPLLNALAWVSITAVLLPYLLLKLLMQSSWTVIIIFGVIIILGLLSSYFMVRSTKIQKSSSYGTIAAENNKKQK